jgi:hypothetical protein
VISSWGRFIGLRDKGFVYETEGKYNELFAAGTQNTTDVIKYMPSLLKASKLSELVKVTQIAQVSELPKKDDSKKISDTEKIVGMGKVTESDNVSESMPVKDNTKKSELPKATSFQAFLKVKYTKDMVWQVEGDWNIPEAGSVRTLNIIGRAIRMKSSEESELIDWGKMGDRYMMVEGFPTENNVEEGGRDMDIIVKLFERNGTLVKEVYKNLVAIVGAGDKGFELQTQGPLVMFFSTKVLKATDKINNKITLPTVDKLSQIGK